MMNEGCVKVDDKYGDQHQEGKPDAETWILCTQKPAASHIHQGGVLATSPLYPSPLCRHIVGARFSSQARSSFLMVLSFPMSSPKASLLTPFKGKDFVLIG